MTDSSPTSRAIFEAVCASLRLASYSSELLTITHLLALKDELQMTLAVVRGQIQSEEFDDNRVTIDLSDWENTSDEEKEDANATDGSEGGGEPPLSIPGPYSMNAPEMDELPEYWYVVSRGTEVGIFTDAESPARTMTGTTCHQIRVKTWSEAVKLYNELYYKGNVVRTRA